MAGRLILGCWIENFILNWMFDGTDVVCAVIIDDLTTLTHSNFLLLVATHW